MQNKLKITKHNALIKSSYRLSLMEIRIVLYGISIINPKLQEFPISYKINIKKFARIFNISEGRLYSDLKEVVIKRFWERDFSYLNDKGKIIMRRWLTDIIYHDADGYLEIFYNPHIKDMLHNMKQHFTSYYLDRIKGMRSLYAIRIYEICMMECNKQNKKSKNISFILTIYDLRKILCLENKYKLFRDFRKRVIEAALSEISKNTDLKINYEITKLGRTPHEIKFNVRLKNTEADFKKSEIILKNKDAKEKERRLNHRPINYSSSSITTLDTPLKSVLRNLEKNKY